MHMTSALISAAVGGTMGTGSGGALAAAGRAFRKAEERHPTLMAGAGAAVFAAQMMNFTIPGTGSSGHIGGGFLLAAVLGPVPAYLAMSIILTVQCLLFGDGGLLALGCNLFNMGVLPCFIVYPLINRFLFKRGGAAKKLGLVLGGLFSMVLGAMAVTAETALSFVPGLDMGAFAVNMLGIHLAIGLVEGLLTLALFMGYEALARRGLRAAVLGTTAAAAVTSGLLSLFASVYPDGLEWSVLQVAGTETLENGSAAHAFFDNIQNATTLLPDYAFRAAQSALSSGAAGLIGCAAVFVLLLAAGTALRGLSARRTA